MSKRIVTLTLDFHHDTDAALLLSDGDTKAWVPKSAVEDHEDGTYSMPESMAQEKGWA